MVNKIIDQLGPAWKAYFEREFSQEYMLKLREFLQSEMKGGAVIYPPNDQWFNAFLYTPFDDVKVVIVGQDPYHGEGQAHGLSFSVPDGIKIPPSLRNIYKELHRDLGMVIPTSGNLEAWAKQGVLLLNASLTVRASQANSHSKQGWLKFTNACIQHINEHKQGVVFLAWGRFAHNVCSVVDRSKHCVIKTSHPSPLGAMKTGKNFVAFMGSGCFSQANEYLEKQGKLPIHWLLKRCSI
ncbi:MAG: uracil-DNA glycosylase [Gammaproteobacteria bacterium]|nr:uracil-DNA glycosylase [Gammaproteobacteria bacterium]